MPLPYTGKHGELNFEQDFVQLLTTAGWEPEILYNKTVDELIANWRQIIFERNRARLNNVPLSDEEMYQLMDAIKQQANTPVKANHFLNTADRGVAVKRDKDSKDTVHAGKEVYLNLFDAREIACGSSRYQIAEQTIFHTGDQYPDRRGDVTLLIDGIPVIHIELKASGVDVYEACTQIRKYTREGIFTGFMGMIQVFWAITPEDALYFANPGSADKFNSSFYFHWGDRDNHIIRNWRELITSENHILSIPEAHKMIGYYAVADTNAGVLKVCRSYQYTAIKAIIKRTALQKWGDHNQKGGFVWCTTGGGKTMTSFKAGQLIIDMNLADKVVFVVDRKTLDEQSLKEYNSFEREGESVIGTYSSLDLFGRLSSSHGDDAMIMTSIQKLSNINEDSQRIDKQTLDYVASKRIVFIIDEAHRSQFGTMHQSVKNTFYNALFFGFTGTPIMKFNMKDGEQTTESVFGPCLAVYSLATGIRDHNVLGFWPEYVSTFDEKKTREKIALSEAHVVSVDELKPGTDAFKVYKYYTEQCPMASTFDEYGNVEEKGIEDFLTRGDFDRPEHREAVADSILKGLNIVEHGVNGTLFHGILATSSIPEAYAYWKLFQEKAPQLHVTALFDPNVNADSGGVVEKEEWLIEIVDKYNADFHTKYDRKSDPKYEGFKSDLIARLAHKKPYRYIGSDHDKCLDIVVVVDQLLTGFDSVYLNVLYMDKVLESDSLIQAISRTNRVYNSDEKPWGMVKFYRKPHTMRRNLDKALEMYCEGDTNGVKEKELKENLQTMNDLYSDIKNIFSHEHIKNFSVLPSGNEDRQKFRKNFTQMKATLRGAVLQGFAWNNEYAKLLIFSEETYRILSLRFSELPVGGGRHPRQPKPGYNLDIDISAVLGNQIDAAYLESRFKILTISEVERQEAKMSANTAIKDIKDHIGVLPSNLQKYALMVLADVQDGKLIPKRGKKLMEYVHEYQDRTIRAQIHDEAEKFGLDEEKFYQLYVETGTGKIDSLKLQELERTADMGKTTAFYGCSIFKARTLLHAELVQYFNEQRTDK